HSDYIVREFNNLIMVSSDNPRMKEVAKKFNYQADEFLNKNDVGTYFFDYKRTAKREANQVIVREIEIDESGFDVPSVDSTINTQNEIAQGLYYTLKYNTENE
ncbi:MAG: hypothetical protein WCP85_12185, partial [Mariniphaga sp.]